MKKIFFVLTVSMFLLSCKERTPEHVTILDSTQYEQNISQNDVTIIDVRTPQEYQDGYIKKAQNINVQSPNFKTDIQNFDKEKPIYIYCRSGMRSEKAGKILEEMGFKEIYDLKGGILSWKGELEK